MSVSVTVWAAAGVKPAEPTSAEPAMPRPTLWMKARRPAARSIPAGAG